MFRGLAAAFRGRGGAGYGYIEALRLANERLKLRGREGRAVIDTAYEHDRPASQIKLNLT